jgi:adenylate cyclase
VISSKYIIEKTGISRATLNNYIKLGILSKPLVRQTTAGEGDAKMLGYFPDWALEKIEVVRRMKREGLTMAEIVARIGMKPGQASEQWFDQTLRQVESTESSSVTEERTLRVTLDDLPHPAYMVNYLFEFTWYNEAARKDILRFEKPPPGSESRNVFPMLLDPSTGRSATARNQLLRLHLSFEKARLSKASLHETLKNLDREQTALIDELYDQSDTVTGPTVAEVPYVLHRNGGGSESWLVYAIYFREGILIVHVPAGQADPGLVEFLSRRDIVLRNLLRKRLPVLTPLAVLLAELQGSVKICSELPPEEYFELINEIWSAMAPVFRKYYGTYGRHVGDGMVYYFFPQPDTNYIFNALACAQELKLEMRKISKGWQLRKNWLNELYLNTGLHEGQEWLGTFQSATSVEIAVLGDTINHAARLSEFARYGAIWATKNLVSKLSPEERACIEYGITRRGEGNQDHFVVSSYAQLETLIDLSSERYEKLREIITLPITEIRSVKFGALLPAQP